MVIRDQDRLQFNYKAQEAMQEWIRSVMHYSLFMQGYDPDDVTDEWLLRCSMLHEEVGRKYRQYRELVDDSGEND